MFFHKSSQNEIDRRRTYIARQTRLQVIDDTSNVHRSLSYVIPRIPSSSHHTLTPYTPNENNILNFIDSVEPCSKNLSLKKNKNLSKSKISISKNSCNFSPTTGIYSYHSTDQTNNAFDYNFISYNNHKKSYNKALTNYDDLLVPQRKKYIAPKMLTTTVTQQKGLGKKRTIVLQQSTLNNQKNNQIYIDHVSTKWDNFSSNYINKNDDDATIITSCSLKDDLNKNTKKYSETCIKKLKKYFKIILPHVILVSILIGYLCFGAWILMLLETKTELKNRSIKLIRITNLMQNFTAESWRLINSAQSGNRSLIQNDEWATAFRKYMLKLAESIDERRPIRKELDAPSRLNNLHNKWTFPSALLYVLTVLTTCGYNEVSVDTDPGKIFSVIFALIGIPLMFITAADIGKFLSDTLLKLVDKWNRFRQYAKEYTVQLFTQNKKFDRQKLLRIKNNHPFETLNLLDTELASTEGKLWFPISAYVLCICLYCSIGSALFINWERTWSFIHAFHFGFNLIVTVGLGDIVVTNYLFLSLIVIFVIVGLSVVTMCVDLASTHLKAYFTRIHYFGRARRLFELSDEVREILTFLSAIRRKKNEKVTWNDLRDFLNFELRDRPYEPHELLMKLQFIDETASSAMSTLRNNSLQSDIYRDVEYIKRYAMFGSKEHSLAYL